MTNRLSPDASLMDVQQLLSGQASRRHLRSQISEMMTKGSRAGSLRLTRAKYKPGRPLRAFFDVPFTPAIPGRSSTFPIAVVWSPTGETPPAAPALQEVEAEIRRRKLNGPFRKLWADEPQSGLHLQAWPLDPSFEQLVRMADPVHLRQVFVDTSDLRVSWLLTPVRYRPGERHVLHLSRSKGDPSRDLFIKLYHRPEEAARAYRIAIRAGEWLAELGGGFEAVRPRDWSEDDSVVFYPHAAGIPLSSLFGQPGLDLSDRLRQAGQTLRALHTDPGQLSADLETIDLAQEVKAVERATRHVQAFLPETGAQIRESLDEILELGSRFPSEDPTFTHSDFKADHLLVNGADMVLIDFDTCAMADPASDVGKFLADLEWWFMLSGRAGLEETQASFLEGYGAAAVPERMNRARFYQALILIKITARRARIYDPNWPDLVTRLVTQAGAILHQAEAPARTIASKS